MRDLRTYTNLSPSWIRQQIKLGTFPTGFRLSNGVVVWKTEDIDAWLEDRFAGDQP